MYVHPMFVENSFFSLPIFSLASFAPRPCTQGHREHDVVRAPRPVMVGILLRQRAAFAHPGDGKEDALRAPRPICMVRAAFLSTGVALRAPSTVDRRARGEESRTLCTHRTRPDMVLGVLSGCVALRLRPAIGKRRNYWSLTVRAPGGWARPSSACDGRVALAPGSGWGLGGAPSPLSWPGASCAHRVRHRTCRR